MNVLAECRKKPGSECFTTAIRASDANDMADDWTGRKLSV
ncbi:hypothetical protein CLOSYM_00282 [[Clostridium] symbiosum ATCC 14940]|uniref:Uncharacterized protein n=1 Tax=[Clostridium] symbiosum ATCC 14940 TaxID=411472 RepID=A0ABC9U396_CLOSY|nr:hypothetical protein CLOSYM_00282 [[Clostridium] symbiosum ATCC 14940]